MSYPSPDREVLDENLWTEDPKIEEEAAEINEEPKPTPDPEQVEEQDLKAGPLGLEYGTTDGEIDKAKLTTPIDRAIQSVPVLGHLDKIGDAAGQGVGDFIADAAGMTQIPWLKKYDQWWDDNNPKSKDPFHTLVRDVSAVVIPSLVGNRLLVGGLANATKARHISTANRTIGSILAQMGIETSIAGITSQSYEQDNAAGALNKMWGWNLPWGTKDGMNPERRRHLHMYEAGAFSAAVDVTLALSSFGKALKKVNLDQKALNLMNQDVERLGKILAEDGLDPLTEAVEGTRIQRNEGIKSEALERISKKSDEAYDPFINEPARPEQRALPPEEVYPPDAVGAKADLYAIQNNLGTVDGQMRPAAGKPVLDAIMNATDGSTRGKALGQFFDQELSANADAIIQDQLIDAGKLNRSVDKLVENLFDPELPFEQFKKIVDAGKTMVFQGRKFLNEEKWVEASLSWKQAHDMMFNPNNMRASAIMTQQAGDTIATTARAMQLLDGIGTNSRQWEIMSKKMKFLVGEVQINKDIVERSATMKKLIHQGDFRRVAEWLNLQADSFDSGIAASKRKAFDVIDEIERIAKEHPEYMRPLAEAYDATNGDINTLYKLHKWGEANIGLLKKGIYDRHPEMPSLIIKGLHAIRYNSILNGLAPVRALVGNSIISTIKPISVFAGAMATADVGTFKRALYTYGGLTENFKRGFKVMGDDWRLANSNPEVAVKHGRHDVQGTDMAKFEAAQTLAEAWRRDGKDGKVAMWNIASALTHWTNWKYERWGINTLYSIDGFFKSLMASGSARAKAYDALMEATNGSFHKSQFQDLQRHIYDQSFDKNGVLRDTAARFASDELALTLDYKAVEHFQSFLNHVPAAKALFMFPRTGMNAVELTWSFNPLSNIGPAITRARRTLSARTADEIAEVLAEHGLDNTPEVFNALKSEYIGRQLMGSGVIMGAGMWALEGNLTGNGPQDGAEKVRMMKMGWQPLSIKNPITGKWHSYRGVEPFESILGLVGDFVFHADRVDQSITEDWFKKALAAITMNVTNATLTSGFEPLVSLYTGDESAWNRYLAQTANTAIPQSGVRTILNNAISPQLRDVKNEFLSQLANMNKFLIPGTTKGLPNYLDVYTGKPIRYHEPITAAANALLPFFKQNGGMEPWRQWLLGTGWDGLTQPRQDEIAEEPLTPHARQYINNWIAKHAGLKERVIEIMNMSNDQWKTELKKYKKNLGPNGKQADYPIKDLILYRLLDDAHTEAFKFGLSNYHHYLQENDPNKVTRGYMRRMIKGQLGEGDIEGAGKTKQDLLNYK